MKIIEASHEILTPSDFIAEAKLIELAGRTAYKSEDKITSDSYDSFIRGIIKRGHEAVIEFGSMAVRFICDRGVSHELVRHRMCSFLQESTRYVCYANQKFGSELTVIRPSDWNTWPETSQASWLSQMSSSEDQYLKMIHDGLKPQQARSVLPNSLKTEIIVRANFREWRHIFHLRCARDAHPDMRALMLPLYLKLNKLLPCVFTVPRIEAELDPM